MVAMHFLNIILLTISINNVKSYIYKSENFVELVRKPFQIYFPIKRSEKFLPPSCGFRVEYCDTKTNFRSLNGSCNNINHPEWGLVNSTYSILLPPVYGNGVSSPRVANDNTSLPSARELRTALFPTGQVENRFWNIFAMIFGQFIAHDMSLMSHPENPGRCCTPDGDYESKVDHFCFPVEIPLDDKTMGLAGIKCMNFTRTITDRDMGCTANEDQPAEQINTVTSFLDLSNVYGLNSNMCNKLRSFIDGKMKVEIIDGHTFPPLENNIKSFCKCNLPEEKTCYKTGDSRSNQNPQLLILQILFVKEHNRIADELKRVNPQWEDERLFQEARRILIAVYQQICYYEWLPIFLGESNLMKNNIIYNTTGFVNDYDPHLKPTILNEHAHSAFRGFHSNIVGIINLYDEKKVKTSSFSLSDTFNRPQMVQGDNVNRLVMGMLEQNMEHSDNILVEEITDQLFACGKKFGIDLKAHDIQRDRDHGLNYYNEYRRYCNLKEATSFEDYSDHISNETVNVLKSLYKSYKDVDLSVGGSLEKFVNNTLTGPTYLCIMNEQFYRTRKSDRFWYENESSGLNRDQLHEIRKVTVSRLFCDNGYGINEIQEKGFALIEPSINNTVKNCSQIPKINFNVWKQ